MSKGFIDSGSALFTYGGIDIVRINLGEVFVNKLITIVVGDGCTSDSFGSIAPFDFSPFFVAPSTSSSPLGSNPFLTTTPFPPATTSPFGSASSSGPATKYPFPVPSSGGASVSYLNAFLVPTLYYLLCCVLH